MFNVLTTYKGQLGKFSSDYRGSLKVGDNYLQIWKLHSTDLEGLAETEVNYPVYPAEGFINATIEIENESINVDIPKIKYGKVKDGKIDAKLSVSVLFNDSPLAYENWNGQLNFEIEINNNLLEAFPAILKPKVSFLEKLEDGRWTTSIDLDTNLEENGLHGPTSIEIENWDFELDEIQGKIVFFNSKDQPKASVYLGYRHTTVLFKSAKFCELKDQTIDCELDVIFDFESHMVRWWNHQTTITVTFKIIEE